METNLGSRRLSGFDQYKDLEDGEKMDLEKRMLKAYFKKFAKNAYAHSQIVDYITYNGYLLTMP
jgi:hypothetical protein